jgi:hypothetical protein
MKRTLIWTVFAGLLISLVFWIYDPYVDDPPDTYKWLNGTTPEHDAIRSYAELNIPSIADFRRLYPNSTVHIAPHFPKNSSTHINCEALVYGRYEVRLYQRVRTNRESLTAVPLGEPTMAVVELEQVGYMPANGGLTKYGNVQRYLGGRAWRKLVAAGGDLSAVIEKPIKNRPLEFADK